VAIIVLRCLTGTALANHLQVDSTCGPGVPGSSPPGGVIGRWWMEWNKHDEIGCALSRDADHPEGDGRYVDFEHGQIVWSQGTNMIVAAYATPHGAPSPGITVKWKVLSRFNYDFFNVRWDRDGSGGDQANHVAANDRTSGSYFIPSGDAGRYRIVTEGCDGGFFTDTCRPGFSLPVYVDLDLPDFAHKIDGSSLEPASDVASARSEARDRLLVAAAYKCTRPFPDFSDGGNEFAVIALAKLVMSDESPPTGPGPCAGLTKADLRAQVNDALRRAAKKSDREVGTEIVWYEGALAAAVEGAGAGAALGAVIGSVFPGIGTLVGAGVGAIVGALGGGVGGAIVCHHKGDYDMTLRGLMPIVYTYGTSLDPDVRKHVVDDLLTETGGSDSVRSNVSICGIKLTETENHVLMTESSRYLTNQLRLGEAEEAHSGDPQSPELALARKKYDNTLNGLETWILKRLQDVLKGDLHEYNARPYARLSTMAIRNLAEYGDRGDPSGAVRLAAQLVLDYLAAKVEVSSNNLRRAAPFRRRDEHWTYGPLFGNASDEYTWYLLASSGDTRLLQDLRYGRADWASPDPILFSEVGGFDKPSIGYQIPDLVLDLFFHRFDNPYFQVVRHEALELYAGQGDFLISGGGIWVEDYYTRFAGISLANVPFGLAGLLGDDTHGFPLPTTLMSSWEGVDRNEFIQIAGSSDNSKRANTCVARGFACGMNPTIPRGLYRRIRAVPRPCPHSVAAVFLPKWNALSADQGPLGCAVNDAHAPSEGDGLVQDFERGEMMWSPKTADRSDKYVQTAYVNFDRDIVFEWGDTDPFHYDFFNVRWDKDGTNLGQHAVQSDDANASPRNGGWKVPSSGSGRYRIVVEGCDGHFLGSSTCRQGWSNPIFIELPLPNSCLSAQGDWTFVDLSGPCAPPSAPDQRGFYVAVHSNQCPSKQCSDAAGGGGSYGFFEAAEPTESGFEGFRQSILQSNPAQGWPWAGENHYVASDGRQITFNPHPGSGRLGVTAISGQATSSPFIDDYRLARGDVIEADGKGCVLVKNSRLKQALVLMMKDLTTARVTTVPLTEGLSCATVSLSTPSPRPAAAERCREGFVWREAVREDHVCVTPATRQAAQDDNARAVGRKDPNGGSFGPDTCLSGFVWREATTSDHVCVTPETRGQTAADNADARNRIATNGQ